MKYLKKYNENSSDYRIPSTSKEYFLYEKVKDICEYYKIKGYSIQEDGTVDVEGNVLLNDKNLDKLPIKFGKVSGVFYCSSNKLKSLEGCPYYVGRHFFCHENELTSLEYGPEHVGGEYHCYRNKLETLDGICEGIDGLNCGNNPIHKYWIQVNDLDKLELFLYMDVNVIDGDEVCQDKVNYVLEQ